MNIRRLFSIFFVCVYVLTTFSLLDDINDFSFLQVNIALSYLPVIIHHHKVLQYYRWTYLVSPWKENQI